MFERFTDRARRVVVLAQEEARLLNHNYIGTEHLLLGLLAEDDSFAAQALEALGVSAQGVRDDVEEIIGPGGSSPSGHIPFTPRAKKVLELALREALQLDHDHIGPEHILLGLVREGEGVGAQVLMRRSGDLLRVRAAVIGQLGVLSGDPVEPRERRRPRRAPWSRRRGETRSMLLSVPGAAGSGCSFCEQDLWEVDRYVAGPMAVICEDCVEASRRVIQSAPSPSGEQQRLVLPPRVSGEKPGDPDAPAAVAAAFAAVFGGAGRDVPDDEVAAALEDGAALLPTLEEARSRYGGRREVGVQVRRLRFVGPDWAKVRFTIHAMGSSFQFDGRARLVDGRWRVSRDTFCEVMARGGIVCPPPPEPA